LPCPEVLAVKIRRWHFQWDASCIQLVSTLWVVMLLIAKQYFLRFRMLHIAAMMAQQMSHTISFFQHPFQKTSQE